MIEAGQAERTRSSATSGTTIASSPRRRSGASSRTSKPRRAVQHGRDQPQHVHRGEHDRAGADDRPAPAGRRTTPARIRNSPANAAEPGHRERDDPGRHQHRRERRPPARHPAERRRTRSCRVRVSTMPASRKSVAETSPCATDCRIGAVDAELVEREEAERDQAHLRHRRVGDDARGCRARGRRAASRRRARRRRAPGSAPAKSSTGSGNFAITIRRKPKTAAFETTPERIAATSGGDSR